MKGIYILVSTNRRQVVLGANRRDPRMIRLIQTHVGFVSSTPCGATPSLLQKFSGGGVDVYNSIDRTSLMTGRRASEPRPFCTWSSTQSPVSGVSVEYPWSRLRDEFTLEFQGIGAVTVQHTAAWTYRLSLVHSSWQIGPDSCTNRVNVRSAENTVVGIFPPVGHWIELRIDDLDVEGWAIIFLVLGSGFVRRSRRFGLLSRTYLPSKFA